MHQYSQLPVMLEWIDCDAFIHFAWASAIRPGRNNVLMQHENVGNALMAIKAAKALHCEVFIGAGSQAEYGGGSQILRPLLCEQLEMDFIWPRFLSMYGPNNRIASVIPMMICTLLKGKKPSLTAGEQLWDYLYASDAADAVYRMAVSGRKGAIYPVGSGEVHPLHEYWKVLRDAIDPSIPLGVGDLPYPHHQNMRLQADIHSLQKDTGFRPRVPFEVGIQKTIAFYRHNLSSFSE